MLSDFVEDAIFPATALVRGVRKIFRRQIRALDFYRFLLVHILERRRIYELRFLFFRIQFKGDSDAAEILSNVEQLLLVIFMTPYDSHQF